MHPSDTEMVWKLKERPHEAFVALGYLKEKVPSYNHSKEHIWDLVGLEVDFGKKILDFIGLMRWLVRLSLILKQDFLWTLKFRMM